jgi:hypothetical protein
LKPATSNTNMTHPRTLMKRSGEGSASPAKFGGTPIRFPALSFSQGLVEAVNSLEDLSYCTRLACKQGWFKNLVLIDSDGRAHKISGARKLRTCVSNAKELFGLLTGNPHWRVDLTLAPHSSDVSLDRFKEMIVQSFKRQEHFWQEMSDFEEFRTRISAAKSIEEVFGAFRDFNKL